MASLSGDSRRIAEESERFQRMVHPLTGESVFAFAEMTAIADGSGALRIEFHHLTTAGPPELSTSVELWSGEDWIKSETLDADLAFRHGLDGPAFEEVLRQKREDITPYIETRANNGTYLDAVHFVLYVLENCNDATLVSLEDGVAVVESTQYDLDASIDTTTGELQSYGLGYSWGSKRVWFVGRMDAALFPARHPLERRGRVDRGMKRKVGESSPDAPENGVIVYTKAERLPKVDPEIFRWQTISQKLFDYETDQVIGPDGLPDAAATEDHKDLLERIKQAMPPLTEQDESGRLTPRKPGMLVASRIGLSLSAGFLILGAVVWYRRRAA